jgi:hypothetical protein
MVLRGPEWAQRVLAIILQKYKKKGHSWCWDTAIFFTTGSTGVGK